MSTIDKIKAALGAGQQKIKIFVALTVICLVLIFLLIVVVESVFTEVPIVLSILLTGSTSPTLSMGMGSVAISAVLAGVATYYGGDMIASKLSPPSL